LKNALIQLHQRLTQTVLGSEDAAEMLLIGLLADGHVLVEGAPGIGKTTIAHTLASSVAGKFRRVQFTPDLLPGDILGYSMYHQSTGEFEFIEGPVFANILLADEINRTSPRVQSALLESMNEGQVSIDGVTRVLEKPFMVIATQNNLYASGTYPLPEPQLDRFLLSIVMLLPEEEIQKRILQLHATGTPALSTNQSPLVTTEGIRQMQAEVLKVHVSEDICAYITALCEATRRQKGLWQGISARASIAVMRAAQAAAFVAGHSSVYPDDVKHIFLAAMRHRVAASDLRDSSPTGTKSLLDDVLRNTPAP
jgi:MoxR-like ATPase